MKKASKGQYKFAMTAFYVLFGFAAFMGVIATLGGAVAGGLFFVALAVLFFLGAWKCKAVLYAADDPASTPEPAKVQVANTQQASASVQNVKKYKVAGVTFHEDNILALAVETSDYGMSKRELIAADMTEEKIWKYFFAPQNVELIPDDGNPEYPEAIKVVVDGQHVGYIKAGSCAHLRKVMANDGIVDIDCTIGGGPYKYISVEHDDETDKEIYTLEKSEINLYVHLNITEKV